MIRDPDALHTVWLFGKPYRWDSAVGALRGPKWQSPDHS